MIPTASPESTADKVLDVIDAIATAAESIKTGNPLVDLPVSLAASAIDHAIQGARLTREQQAQVLVQLQLALAQGSADVAAALAIIDPAVEGMVADVAAAGPQE